MNFIIHTLLSFNILARNLFRGGETLNKTKNRKGKLKGQTSNKCISIFYYIIYL